MYASDFLFLSYLDTDERLVLPFLLQPNRVYLEDAVTYLRSFDKSLEMVMLFRSRGMHREALDLLAIHMADAASAR